MKLKVAFAAVLALGHVILVVFGAASSTPEADQPNAGIITNSIGYYATLSGADNGYGFFAPGVAAELRATFTMTDAQGRTWTDTLESSTSHEAELRVTGIVCMYVFERLRGGLLHSWAATMFGRHPEAVEVRIDVEIYDPPTMEEFREGMRAEWEILDTAVFQRNRGNAAQ
jgi:hypothetical protein